MKPNQVFGRDICVFVSSSDNTFDVFDVVSPSVARNWPNGLQFFVGLNSKFPDPPFRPIFAPVAGWRKELSTQIAALPTDITRIFLLLDDFFFHEPIDGAYLRRCIAAAKSREMDYLRLRALRRSMTGKAALSIQQRSNRGDVFRIDHGEPYYSSLQLALWRRDYLSRVLSLEGSIWDFEHQVVPNSKHYAVRRDEIAYEHLVEKGRWLSWAPKILRDTNPRTFQKRGFESSIFRHSKIINRLRFGVFGYSIFKLRRALQRK